jgi:putative heme iron utilization protein
MAINLSSTTPVAPSGSTLITFQTDGSGNVSGYVTAAPTLFTANKIDLTAQTANVAAANLLASPTVGTYRVSAYIIVTTVDAVSSTLPSVVITWTDRDNSTAQTITLTATSTGNTLTTYKTADVVISASASAAIQYSTTGYLSNTPATMQYALHIRIEQI